MLRLRAGLSSVIAKHRVLEMRRLLGLRYKKRSCQKIKIMKKGFLHSNYLLGQGDIKSRTENPFSDLDFASHKSSLQRPLEISLKERTAESTRGTPGIHWMIAHLSTGSRGMVS